MNNNNKSLIIFIAISTLLLFFYINSGSTKKTGGQDYSKPMSDEMAADINQINATQWANCEFMSPSNQLKCEEKLIKFSGKSRDEWEKLRLGYEW